MDGLVKELVDGLVKELVDGLVKELVDGLVKELVDGLVKELVDGLIKELVDGLVKELVDGLVKELVDGLVKELVDGLVKELVDGLVKELVDGLVKELLRSVMEPDVLKDTHLSPDMSQLTPTMIQYHLNHQLVHCGTHVKQYTCNRLSLIHVDLCAPPTHNHQVCHTHHTTKCVPIRTMQPCLELNLMTIPGTTPLHIEW